MKKIVVFLCVAVMLCAVALTSSAATVGTAYTIEYSGISLDIDIIDDFSSYTGTETYGDFQYTFDNGKLVLEMPMSGWGWEGPTYESPSLELDGLEDAYNNAIYVGFSIKNTGDATGVLCLEDRVKDPLDFSTQTWIMDGIKLVSKDGIADATGTSVPSRQYGIDIPAGFDGWLFIPFTAMKIKQESFNKGEDIDNFVAKFECPHFTGFAKGGDEGAVLEIDNLFLSSAELVVNEPNEPEKPTADVSVIAYAAMAITGLGALVVAKKR